MKEMGRRRRRRGHKKVCGKREADGENRGKGGGRGIRMTEVWKRWTLMRDAEERGKKTGREMCILLKILYRWRTGHMQVKINKRVSSLKLPNKENTISKCILSFHKHCPCFSE